MDHESHRSLKFVWKDIPYKPEAFSGDGFYSSVKGSAPFQWRLYFKDELVTADSVGRQFCMYLEWVKHNALPQVSVSSATMHFSNKTPSSSDHQLTHKLRQKVFSHTGMFAWADKEIRKRTFEESHVRTLRTGQRLFSVCVRIRMRITPALKAFFCATEEHRLCLLSYATDADKRLVELIGVQPVSSAKHDYPLHATVANGVNQVNGGASAPVNGHAFLPDDARVGGKVMRNATSKRNTLFSDDDDDDTNQSQKAFSLVTAPPVHLNMLIRMAPVFATMLGADMLESKTAKVEIVDFSPKIIAQLAEYCENGPMNVDLAHTANELVYLADKYEANGLVRLCTECIKLGVTKSNVLDRLRTSVALNLHDLREICLEYLESPEGVSKLQDFMDVQLKPSSVGDFKLLRDMMTYYVLRTVQLKQKLSDCAINVPKKLRSCKGIECKSGDSRKRKRARDEDGDENMEDTYGGEMRPSDEEMDDDDENDVDDSDTAENEDGDEEEEDDEEEDTEEEEG